MPLPVLTLIVPAHAKGPPVDGTAIRDRVLPLVEEIAGRSLATPPEVRVLRSERFADRLAQEQAAIHAVLYPGVPPSAFGAVGLAAELVAPAVIGKYGPFDHTVHLAPDALAKLDADEAALAECVVAHELVHALQRGALEQVLLLRDREALEAFSMVAEGHATWIHERVCDRLGHPELREPMRDLLGFEAEPPTAYAIGLRFVEADPQRIWSVLAAPPADTAMVWFPERYAPGPPPERTRIEPLRDAALGLLKTGAPAVVEDRLGYDALLRELRGDPEGLDGLGVALQAGATDGRGTVLARRIGFDSPEHAASYLARVRTDCGELGVDGIPSAWPLYVQPSEAAEDGLARCHVTVRPSNLPVSYEVDRWAAESGADVHVLVLIQVERKPDVVHAVLAGLATP